MPNRLVTRLAAAALACAPLPALAQAPPEKPAPPTLPAPTPVQPAFPAPPSILGPCAEPISLPAALRLANADNPEIGIARERITEAVALRQLAAAQILPNLNAGTSVDVHTGVLQQSNGTILKVNRGSLDLGLGTNAVGAGTISIPGIAWAGNIDEGIVNALVARQVVRERQFAATAVTNDILLRVAVAYLELLRAEGRRALFIVSRDEAQEVARVTANFASTGQGRQADADRAATELRQRTLALEQAEADLLTASARLAELLSLDPAVRLRATDGWVVPAPIVPDPIPLTELIAVALMRRPELAAQQAVIRAALLELQGAKLLPFSPTVLLGYSAGTFGGGSNLVSQGIVQANGTVVRQPRFDSFDDRQDIDAVAFWTLRNLGVGNLALVRVSQSHVRASRLRLVEVLDRVRTEVATAYAGTHARFAQIETAEQAVRTSQRAFEEDFRRTRNQEGLPIEVFDSLRLLDRSRTAYLDAIVDYNEAQFRLYVALGQPPADTLARPVPADLVPPPPPPPAAPPR